MNMSGCCYYNKFKALGDVWPLCPTHMEDVIFLVFHSTCWHLISSTEVRVNNVNVAPTPSTKQSVNLLFMASEGKLKCYFHDKLNQINVYNVILECTKKIIYSKCISCSRIQSCSLQISEKTKIKSDHQGKELWHLTFASADSVDLHTSVLHTASKKVFFFFFIFKWRPFITFELKWVNAAT